MRRDANQLLIRGDLIANAMSQYRFNGHVIVEGDFLVDAASEVYAVFSFLPSFLSSLPACLSVCLCLSACLFGPAASTITIDPSLPPSSSTSFSADGPGTNPDVFDASPSTARPPARRTVVCPGGGRRCCSRGRSRTRSRSSPRTRPCRISGDGSAR